MIFSLNVMSESGFSARQHLAPHRARDFHRFGVSLDPLSPRNAQKKGGKLAWQKKIIPGLIRVVDLLYLADVQNLV
jgi:hypothetical protein